MFADSRFHWWSKRIAASKKPILVGPWRTEVGFEVLYWLPWLQRWMERYQIDPARCVAISRGGAAHWYGMGQAVELYDYWPVASVRRQMLADSATTGSVKHVRIATQERDLLKVIAQDCGIRAYHVLHPSLVYQQLAPWWGGDMGLSDLLARVAFSDIPTPFAPLTMPLPEQFVAVGFYARHTWPMDEERKDWTANLVDGLAKICPVVVLDSGLHADEHVSFPISGPNILSTAPYCTPTTNLAVQSAVLAKAQGFVGTYGGTMQLAVRLKKPSIGFYTHFTGTAYAHKALTEWLGVQQQTPVCIGRPEDAKYVQEAMQITYVPAPVQRGSSVATAPK